MKTRSLSAALLLAFWAALATPAAARQPMGRYITGTIQKVDARTIEVFLRRDTDGSVINFVCVDRTRIWNKHQPADPSTLRKGLRLEVIRHVPILGKPFVTRVTLLPTKADTK